MPSLRLVTAAVLVAVMASGCGADGVDPPSGARGLTIPTPDGESLDAIELGRGGDVAILSHGATGTKEDFFALASALADDGWRVIVYDARGVGDSTGSAGAARDVDLRAVTAFARERGATTLVLAGGSLGASLSIAMAVELEADGVVSLSAPAGTFGALDAAAGLGGTALFVAVARDDEPFTSDAAALASVADVRATIVNGDRHGTGILRDHPELVDAIVRFAADVRSR